MRVFLDRLYLFSGYLAGAFMLAIFVLMMVLSAGRPIGLNIPAADDFVSWCMAAMAFLGLAHTFRNGEMIRVGLLIDRLPDKSRHWIEIVCLVVGIGFIGFFSFYACQLIRDSWRFHEMSQGVISIPMWIPQIGYAAGLIILLIAFIDEFIHVVRGNPPRYALSLVRRRGARIGPVAQWAELRLGTLCVDEVAEGRASGAAAARAKVAVGAKAKATVTGSRRTARR